MNARQKAKKAKELIQNKDFKIKELEEKNQRYIDKIKAIENKNSREYELKDAIIKSCLTRQVGGLKCGMMIDMFEIDRMKDLELAIEEEYREHAIKILVRPRLY